MKKRKTVLTVALIVALACVTAFAVWGYIDVRRESEYIAAQPGSSGVDFLGPSIMAAAVVIITYMLAALAVDIYISLWYFLVSAVRRRVKTVINAVALVLSAISLLFFVFICVLDTGINNGLFTFGFFWSLAIPLYRVVYLCVGIVKGLHNNEEAAE